MLPCSCQLIRLSRGGSLSPLLAFAVNTQGSCEPDHGAWAPGKPFYIPPKQGCIEHEEEEEEEHVDVRRMQSEEERQQLRRQRILSAAIGGLGGLVLGPEQPDLVLAANVSKTRLRVDDAAQARFLESLGTPAAVFEVRGSVGSWLVAFAWPRSTFAHRTIHPSTQPTRRP